MQPVRLFLDLGFRAGPDCSRPNGKPDDVVALSSRIQMQAVPVGKIAAQGAHRNLLCINTIGDNRPAAVDLNVTVFQVHGTRRGDDRVAA